MCTSSATMIAATTSTARPSSRRPPDQTRSGTLTRAGAFSGTRSGSRAAVTISLAVCKHGLSLHRYRLQRRLHLLHERRREGRIVERRRHLLAVVDGPPEEMDQRLTLRRVGLILVDEQV